MTQVMTNAERVARWREENPERYRSQIEATKARGRRKLDILDRYKLRVGCSLCGYRGAAVALDFHHVDPSTKSFGLHESRSRSWARVKAEVRKCSVVCANCHRIVESQYPDPIPHSRNPDPAPRGPELATVTVSGIPGADRSSGMNHPAG